MAMPLRDARVVFERQYLSAQLLRFGGNISRAAVFVNMERSALHRKLKSLGIAVSASTRATAKKVPKTAKKVPKTTKRKRRKRKK